MWSEPGSDISSEPPGGAAVSRIGYILRRSDSALLLSQGELVGLVDSGLSQGGAVTCGGEHQDHHQGVVQEDIKTETYSPALSQWSRLIRVFVCGTVSLCKALLRYRPLCDTDLQSCVIV